MAAKPRLPDQVREALRVWHCNYRTDRQFVDRIWRHIRHFSAATSAMSARVLPWTWTLVTGTDATRAYAIGFVFRALHGAGVGPGRREDPNSRREHLTQSSP